jgi:hypothetical protein
MFWSGPTLVRSRNNGSPLFTKTVELAEGEVKQKKKKKKKKRRGG